ncbi:MAG: hypothetical protein J6U04_06255 [Salinivirgaceae bacterium]|nr:hypothetical protein [Salinivirgaceae bacterium]
MKRLLVEISAILLLIVSLCANAVQRNERDRLRSNIEALNDNLDYYMTADSVMVARVKRQTLTIDELKADNNRLADEIKAMNIKLKHLQGATTINQQTRYIFIADTVLVVDTVEREIEPSMQYHDEWIDFKMLGRRVEIETRDSLIVVHYQRRRKFLWFTWARKTPEVAVENRNPNAKILGIKEICVVQ